MKHTYQFPDRDKRNYFLSLCDARVGQFGIGCGLEFDGLRFVLESDKGGGRLKCLRCNAYGDWKVAGSTVEIDWGFIEVNRQDFKKLLEQLGEVARRFGEGTGGGRGGYGNVSIKW
jgi:hypothetical protein